MKTQLIGMLLASAVAMVLPVATAIADDMPFWGDGSPNTNRVASASQTRTIGSFSSRDFCFDSIALENFDSTKPRFIFIVY